MKRYHSEPQSAVVAVITNAELADWIGVGDDDPLLPIMAQTATAAAIDFLQSELIDRERVTYYENWPTVGTIDGRSLSPSNAGLKRSVDLPYSRPTGLVVSEVLVTGEATTDFRVLQQLPAALYFEAFPGTTSDDEPSIKATYTTGYGPEVADVPQAIRTAVTMAADFLYNNRGTCSADQALEKSGAAVVLTPYKTAVVII